MSPVCHRRLFHIWFANEEAEGGVAHVANNHSQNRAQNYSGAQFNVLTRGKIPGRIPSLSHAGDWEVKLYRSIIFNQ